MKRISYTRRAAVTLSALGLMGGLGACSDLLEVSNPGVIVEADLADSTLVAELLNAPVGSFNATYASYAYASAIFTDEAVSGHNFNQWQDVDARVINDGNAGYAEYVALHRIRFLGQNMVARATEFLGAERASRDARVAEAILAGAYATLLLGESLCESPLEGNDAAKPSAEIFQAAIPTFEQAIAVATAAGDAQTLRTAQIGLARTYLNLGNDARAVELAASVPLNHVAWARYSSVRAAFYNPFRGHTEGQNFNLGVDPKFQSLDDPRIQHRLAVGGHNALYPVAAPYQSPAFSGYEEGDTVRFVDSTDVQYASGLEARYIVAEAQGPTAANVTFLNARRAIGNLAPLGNDVAVADYRRALLDQRGRDFFMGGQRLGDLRRFKARYAIDEFPSGENPNPGGGYGAYGTDECFRPTTGERIGNPNY